MKSPLLPPRVLSWSSRGFSRTGSRLVGVLAFLAITGSADRASAAPAPAPTIYMLNPHPTFERSPWAALRIDGGTGVFVPPDRTIAPFPVPGDTSRASIELWKSLNLPKRGLTTVAPLPPPVPFRVPAPVGDSGGASPKLWLGLESQRGDSLPEVGDYVFVEEHPYPIEHPRPTYPEAARRAKVGGTVVVQGIVLRDGSVDRAKVVKSIPELDQAVLDSFRKWRFKPAMTGGVPVPVWIAVPFRF